MKTKKLISTFAMLLLISLLSGAIAVEAGVTFTVDSTTDAVDANPGDGLCATAAGECTLRAAIQETNALSGADTIQLPVETFTLALIGGGEDAAASGDLDISDDLFIIGGNYLVEQPWTTIQGGQLDRVFHILPGGSVEIDYVVISLGDAQDPAGGGGILNQGELSLYTTKVVMNHAGGKGGGVKNEGHLSCDSCEILNNGALEGGAIYNSGTLSIYSSSINDNVSTGSGGGIYNTEEAIFTLHWAGVSSNTVTGTADGGGIYNLGYMELGEIAMVSFNKTNGSGGGIYNAGTMQVLDLDSSNNFAGIDGGSIYNIGNALIQASFIYENNASSGAGIYSEWLYTTTPSRPMVTVEDTSIYDNHATLLAGGILNAIGTLTIDNSSIESNTANIAGGIASFSGSMTLTDTTVANNSAISQGGGFFNTGDIHLSESYVHGNSASSGGAFYNNQYALINLSETSLSGNSAENGGGIHNLGIVSISNSILQNNIAKIAGGGLLNTSGYADVDHSSFYANSAQTGGAIWNGSSSPEQVAAMTDSMDEHISALFSTALEMQREKVETESQLEPMPPGFVIVMTSTIGANTATHQGGGIFTLDEVQLLNSTFSDNSAAEGDSIFIGETPAKVIIGNTILASSDVDDNCAGHQLPESLGFNLETGDSCALRSEGDLIETDPLLMFIEFPGIGLHPLSPAVDAGSNALCGNTDQRGVPRPIDGTGDGQAICDIGSYEAPEPDLIFADVPLNHWAYDYIISLYEDGYIAGCATDPERLFCPQNTMNRAESSVFVVRGLHPDVPGYLPPTPTIQYFDDVPIGVDEEWFSKWVGELYEQGFTSGCSTNPPLYCPLTNHNRAEATVFYLRMLNGADFMPADPTSQTFNDVTLDKWYAPWVQAAYEANLIQPCQTDLENMLFRPEEDLTRAEAACMMFHAVSKQVKGSVLIEGGQPSITGTVGEIIEVDVAFQASSPTGTVTEMRVLTGNQPPTASEMKNAVWEPFATQKIFFAEAQINSYSLYVHVQYRDSHGNVSPILHDDIVVEGQPIEPTPTPTFSPPTPTPTPLID